MKANQAGKISKYSICTTSYKEQRTRIQLAVAVFQETNRTVSLSQVAKRYDIPKSILSDQIQGSCDQVLYISSRQRLMPEEEACLEN